MNLLAWLLALSTLVLVLIRAVAFHKATVCRQDAWLQASLLSTRALLPKQGQSAFLHDRRCSLLVTRQGKKVTWRRFPSLRTTSFELSLRGKL